MRVCSYSHDFFVDEIKTGIKTEREIDSGECHWRHLPNLSSIHALFSKQVAAKSGLCRLDDFIQWDIITRLKPAQSSFDSKICWYDNECPQLSEILQYRGHVSMHMMSAGKPNIKDSRRRPQQDAISAASQMFLIRWYWRYTPDLRDQAEKNWYYTWS